MSVLAHKWVSSGALGGSADFARARVGVVLHGILGTGRNWMAPAKKLVQSVPGVKVLLVDLRCHGASRVAGAPHTVEACAEDVAATLRAAVGAQAPTPSTPCATSADAGAAFVVGHSFGGKVALAYAAQRAAKGLEAPRHTLLVDSVPGASRAVQTGVDGVIEALAAAAADEPFASRAEATRALEAKGLDAATAAWLASAVEQRDGGFHFQHDVPGIVALYDAYRDTDLWHVAHDLAADGSFALLTAGKNPAPWAPWRADLDRLGAHGAHFTAPESGHNVHVDNLPRVVSLLVDHVTRRVLAPA
ncbi:Alpha/Beta hydrolase protein [Pelagophyceae sp. CCMP2097]|nr:Alpha/Beta hydrolase protein [Pelagophyceae sp. CCMP2097]|mmetsp:Transcript_29418/g.101723  ORF Transcript_29418/g.101723 Transcript_29418/m.101723 type:complete len:304 (+) Transcript_29418:78-989(+)